MMKTWWRHMCVVAGEGLSSPSALLFVVMLCHIMIRFTSHWLSVFFSPRSASRRVVRWNVSPDARDEPRCTGSSTEAEVGFLRVSTSPAYPSSSSSAFSLFGIGAHWVFNLHVLRSCASSLSIAFSFVSFLWPLRHSFSLSFGVHPLSPSMSSLLSSSPHRLTISVSLLLFSYLWLPQLPSLKMMSSFLIFYLFPSSI